MGGRQESESGSASGPLAALDALGRRVIVMIDQLGRPSTRERAARASRTPALALAALVAVLGGLGVSVVAVAGVATGVHAGAARLAGSKSDPPRSGRTVAESMEIQTGKMDGKPGWPRYTNAFWSVRRGDTVVLRITSYDDGTAPLEGPQAGLFDRVQGTLGGTETVGGRPVSSIPNGDVAHTFTVPALGLNVPIPVAPKGGSVTVVARFVPERTGVFVWQCYAPCGTGMNAMGGAMSTMGWMEGKVTVLA